MPRISLGATCTVILLYYLNGITNMKSKKFLVALTINVVALSACQKSESPVSRQVTNESPVAAAMPAAGRVPKPVEMFEMYCFRNSANYQRIIGLAKLNRLRSMPKEFEPAVAAEVGKGTSFIIEANKEPKRTIFLGLSDLNTCTIAAMGYDRKTIQVAMRENYHLKLANKDDTGLQISELYIPNGVKGSIMETHEYGVIGVTYSKDPKDDTISLSFMPPEVAETVFKL